MLKNHITKVVAVLMAVLMLMSIVPAAALPEFTLPEIMSVLGGSSDSTDTDASQDTSAQDGDTTASSQSGTQNTNGEEGTASSDSANTSDSNDLVGDSVVDEGDYDIFENVELGKDAVTNTESYTSGAVQTTNDSTGSGQSWTEISKEYSAYEPIKTDDENHPFLPGNAAWIDLEQVYYGAPATPNFPITKWSANTSVYNVTGTGDYYECGCVDSEGNNYEHCPTHASDGTEIFSMPDLNLIDDTLWVSQEAAISSHTDEDGNEIVTWENGIATSGVTKTISQDTVISKYEDTTAYVYNRYDAMQGKWGLTLDKNVSSVSWIPSYKGAYYGAQSYYELNLGNQNLNNSELYLTDTPYLYYSTEALDTTQIAIALLIGAPVQSENIENYTTGQSTVSNRGDYEYRWYIITDNADRPGISTESQKYDMTPNVYISDVVLKDVGNDASSSGQSSSKVFQCITDGYKGDYTSKEYDADLTKLDPIAWAEKENANNTNFDVNSLYANGSITGCIDFTTLLPMVMGSLEQEIYVHKKDGVRTDYYVYTGSDGVRYYKNGSKYYTLSNNTMTAADVTGITLTAVQDTQDNGSQDVKYKIANIRVDTKTAEGAQDSAARINYLYFGPGLSMVYTPQSTVGSDVNASNWMYAQLDDALGDQEPNTVAGFITSSYKYPCGYTNGWENGQAVSITNTPLNPQLISIDTYGQSGGKLITYDEYETITGKDFTRNSWDYGTNSSGTGDMSRIWMYTDDNGVTQYLETQYNEKDKNHYIMVTIPVRKWIDVLGNARKLSFTLQMQRYGLSTDYDETTDTFGNYTQNNINPSFGFWGNESGTVGSGHSSWALTTRFRHEDILAMFGTGYYHVDNGYNYSMAEVDLTTGASAIYNQQAEGEYYYHELVTPDDGSASYNKVVSATYLLYTDADGVTYYEKDGVLYTGEQIVRDGLPLYVLPDSENNVYYYDASTKTVYNGGDPTQIEEDILFTQLVPMYEFTQSDVAASSLEKTYAAEESWFDLLRSPYMLENTVINGSTQYYYGEEMVGYCYVSAMRFAVPIGAEFTIQNIKGDGNSAGLNTYSTAGNIVSAYDGGTGVQPEIDVTSDSATKTESVMSFTEGDGTDVNGDGVVDNGDGTFTATANGTLKGTQTLAAAAYGPYLNTSYYTIYDLIDTEKLNSSGVNSHYKSRQGLEVQKIYGKVYKRNVDKQFPITATPNKTVTYTSSDTGFAEAFKNTIDTTIFKATQESDSNNYNPVYGFTYGKGTNIIVYAGLQYTELGETWGLVGVLDKNGAAQIGWVLLADDGTRYYSSGDSEYGYLYDGNLTLDGDGYDYYVYDNEDALNAAWDSSYGLRDHIRAALSNELYYSNLGGKNGGVFTNFQTAAALNTGTADAPAYTGWQDVSTHAGQYATYHDLVKNDKVVLAYANQWAQDSSSTSYLQIPDITVSAANATDMQVDINSLNDSANFTLGMTRIFDQSIKLSASDYDSPGTYHYPSFYFDYSSMDFSGSASTSFGLIVKVTYNDGYDANGNVITSNQYATDLWVLNQEGKLQRTSVPVDGGDGGYLGDKSVNSVWGYYNMQELMEYYTPKKDGALLRDANRHIYFPTIEIVGFNMYFSLEKALKDGDKTVNDQEITIRRMEIRQVETTWLDEMNYTTHANGETVLADSMNIINDAYFSVHDETQDGQYILTPTVDENDSRVSYTVTDTLNTVTYDKSRNSYRKGNSNKGWSAKISTDTNGDKVIDSKDTTYYSSDGTEVDGVYEYRSALGHLRVWVPGQQQASVVFTADRSFNTDNYRYLYYSYSVRDLETGISAEDNENGSNTGIAVAIKSQQNHSDQAYLERDGSWVYYPEGTFYWSDSGHDDRQFDTNMCAALDLSTLDGIDSVNQFVFYLHNDKPAGTKAEYYINYIYLSNVPPVGTVAEELQEPQVQYYYMMDNTGDRYSARYPTLDNPTGAVTGLNTDSDRVNPIVVERGANFYMGTYFNGEPLGSYGTATDDGNGGSLGGYTNTYDETIDVDAYYKYIREVWFYDTGDNGPTDDILDYYTYKDRDGDGDGDKYDMLWSYGRWYTGDGESALNTMYITETGNNTEQADYIYGNLVRRYATENYILLRAGIEPRKHTTYFDAAGGEFIYQGSSDEIKNGDAVTENSYYINATALMSYFKDHTFYPEIVKVEKPGYTFKYWQRQTLPGDTDTRFGDQGRLMKYVRKETPGIDYFVAVWEKDESAKSTTAKFYKTTNTSSFTDGYLWKEISTTIGTDTLNGDYVLTIPAATTLMVDGVKKRLYGWQMVDASGNVGEKVYSFNEKIYLTEDASFIPVLEASSQNTFSMKTYGARLYTVTTNGYTQPIEAHGATAQPIYELDDNGNETTTIIGYSYTNVIENMIITAIPLDKVDGNVWTVTTDTNGDKQSLAYNGMLITVMSSNSEKYCFTAHENIDISYGVNPSAAYYEAQDDIYITTSSVSPTATGDYEMKFYSQYFVEGTPAENQVIEVQAAGTLYTKSAYYETFDDTIDMIDANMRLNATTVNATSVLNKSYKTNNTTAVRFVQATESLITENNEYLLRVTGTKDKSVTYYARGYVIYTVTDTNGTEDTTDDTVTYKIAYSDVVAIASVNVSTTA